MNIFKMILANEVYPALGCTEPIACAYAAAIAASHLDGPIERLILKVDRGTYKNGAAVTVPFSGSRKGNLIAAVLGAHVGKPEAKLQVLGLVTDSICAESAQFMEAGKCEQSCLEDKSGFHVDLELLSSVGSARCVLSEGHTNLKLIQKNNKTIYQADERAEAGGDLSYRQKLKAMTFQDLFNLADSIDEEDIAYLKKGIEMNFEMAQEGEKINGTASQLHRMKEDGYLADDMFFKIKSKVASAVDARMAGLNRPVMTSGGSGNQGAVAILTLYTAGKEMGIPEEKILRSIALAHCVNSYIKCYIGELSVICGCAMAAGIAAAAGIVFQQAGPDMAKVTFAVNNVIGDLSGLICDGAKPGCAMKSITSADSALRSALMALGGYGLSEDEGLLGDTVEDSIRNLCRITLEGMFQVDPTVLKILNDKASGRGTA